MQDARLFDKWTLQGILAELDVIELFEAPEHGRVLGEITEKRRICIKRWVFRFHRYKFRECRLHIKVPPMGQYSLENGFRLRARLCFWLAPSRHEPHMEYPFISRYTETDYFHHRIGIPLIPKQNRTPGEHPFG